MSSTHKLVGSLTQSAMLHLGDGPFAARLEPLVERAMTLVESTSASSILVASLDGARPSACGGRSTGAPRVACLSAILARIEALDAFSVADRRFTEHPDVAFHDPLRVVIDVSRTGQSGTALRSFLHDAQCIDFEVFTHAAIVAVVGPRRGVHPEVERLIEALRQIPAAANRTTQPVATVFYAGKPRLTPREALSADSELVDVQRAAGRVSSDTLSAYPPGIPNVVGGEESPARCSSSWPPSKARPALCAATRAPTGASCASCGSTAPSAERREPLAQAPFGLRRPDPLVAQHLLARALAADDRHFRRPQAETGREQPADCRIGLAVDRWRTDATSTTPPRWPVTSSACARAVTRTLNSPPATASA